MDMKVRDILAQSVAIIQIFEYITDYLSQITFLFVFAVKYFMNNICVRGFQIIFIFLLVQRKKIPHTRNTDFLYVCG